MEATIKSTQKVAYTLQWLDVDGAVTTSPVTNISVSNGDGSVATVVPSSDHEGFIIAQGLGVIDLVWKGVNADNEEVSGTLTLTVKDETGGGDGGDGGTPAKVAKSIGIVLGEPVDK